MTCPVFGRNDFHSGALGGLERRLGRHLLHLGRHVHPFHGVVAVLSGGDDTDKTERRNGRN